MTTSPPHVSHVSGDATGGGLPRDGASRLTITNARVLTLAHGPRPRRGAALGELGVVPLGEVEIERGRIAAVRTLAVPRAVDARDPAQTDVLDAAGRVLMPAFVDCHTHACFAGDRLDEWQRKLAGATYLDILKAGGGIMSTVRATRQAGREELARLLRARLDRMARAGTLSCEVKSGYGLSLDGEMEMLRAIRDATRPREAATSLDDPRHAQPHVVPTALLGHAIDADASDSAACAAFVERTIAQTLPAVSAAFPGVAVDAFCERGAWSVEDCVRLFEAARARGHPLRVHADQFTSMGMVREAIRLGARSIDHLEATSTHDLEALAASDTFGVMLPVCGFHVDGRYANAGWFVRAGGSLCLASNYNPGSAPSFSMPLVIALAVRHMAISPAEAIAACTVNPATLLGLDDRGTIAPGQRADLLLLRHADERLLAYEVDAQPIAVVICGGHVIARMG